MRQREAQQLVETAFAEYEAAQDKTALDLYPTTGAVLGGMTGLGLGGQLGAALGILGSIPFASQHNNPAHVPTGGLLGMGAGAVLGGTGGALLGHRMGDDYKQVVQSAKDKNKKEEGEKKEKTAAKDIADVLKSTAIFGGGGAAAGAGLGLAASEFVGDQHESDPALAKTRRQKRRLSALLGGAALGGMAGGGFSVLDAVGTNAGTGKMDKSTGLRSGVGLTGLLGGSALTGGAHVSRPVLDFFDREGARPIKRREDAEKIVAKRIGIEPKVPQAEMDAYNAAKAKLTNNLDGLERAMASQSTKSDAVRGLSGAHRELSKRLRDLGSGPTVSDGAKDLHKAKRDFLANRLANRYGKTRAGLAIGGAGTAIGSGLGLLFGNPGNSVLTPEGRSSWLDWLSSKMSD